MDAWDGILAKDEKIIWQGRPLGTFKLQPPMSFVAIFGTLFTGFALVWIFLAASSGGFLWLFGLIHFGVGAGIVIDALFKPGFVRRRTWYTLTNKRGYIATDLPIFGRRLRSYSIGPETGIDLVESTPPCVYFGFRQVRRNRQTVQEPDGFQYIADAPEVMRLIRDIQDPANHSEAP